MPSDLRFALICDSLLVPDWQAHCLRLLRAVDHVKPVLAFVAPVGARPPATLWQACWTSYVERRARSLRPTSVHSLVQDAAVHPWDRDAPQRARAAELDFILHLGAMPLDGDDLLVGRYGMWTFSFSEEGRRWQKPPAFWEIYHQQPLAGLALLRRTGGEEYVTLQRGTVNTIPYSYPRAVDALLYAGVEWPARICRQILAGTPLCSEAAIQTLTPPAHRVPNAVQTARVLARTTRALGTTILRYLIVEDHWNVGIVDEPAARFLSGTSMPAARWLPGLPRGTYIADPFAVRQGPDLVLLVEEYRAAAGRGAISTLTVRANGEILPLQPALGEPWHMAYPFIVRQGTEIYCIPDTSQRREVVAYRAIEFPYRWEKAATLLQGFMASDSAIFRHGGRWWLFCSGRDRGGDTGLNTRESGAQTTLYAWYADDLLGPWKEHVCNPLKVDARSSRPAGTPFEHDGNLYRPAQDCSRTYGGAISINHILRLTPVEFEEETVARIEPLHPYADGVHTLAAVGDVTVIDGNRSEIVLAGLPAKLIRILRRVRGVTP